MDWSKARKEALLRDEGKCLRCRKPAADVHHRRPKKMGGTKNEYTAFGMANLVSLCRKCHNDIHAHPEQAYRTGYLVHSWDDPAHIPITSGEIQDEPLF